RRAPRSFPTRRSSDLIRAERAHDPPHGTRQPRGAPAERVAAPPDGRPRPRGLGAPLFVDPGGETRTPPPEPAAPVPRQLPLAPPDRKSTRLNSSHVKI